MDTLWRRAVLGKQGWGKRSMDCKEGEQIQAVHSCRGLSPVCPGLSVARPHKLLQRGERGEFDPSVSMGVTSPYFCVAHVWVSYLSGNREAPGHEESS